jgi:hypothetical protein
MTRMQHHSPQAYAFNAQAQPSCPECQGATLRIWRRPVDRLSALLMPSRRYRCQSFQCQWEGNIRQRPRAMSSGTYTSDDPSSLSRVFLLSMAIALAAATFIVIATTTEWLEPGGLLVSTQGTPFNPFSST